jgi:HEAT repeat protein
VRRRTIILLSILLCGLVIAFIAGIYFPSQPIFNGRTLENWLTIHLYANYAPGNAGQKEEAESAIRQVGTNAIPALLSWISQPGALRIKLGGTINRFPKALGSVRAERAIVGDALDRAKLATEGFRVLGQSAASAVPRLFEIANITNSTIPSANAVTALAYIGPPALESLAKLARDTKHPRRIEAMQEIQLIIEHMPDPSWAAPLVIPLIQDKARAIASSAIGAMDHMGPQALEPLAAAARNPLHPARVLAMETLINVTRQLRDRCQAAPLIIHFVHDTDPEIARLALGNMYLFSKCEAAPAVADVLTQALSAPNPWLRKAAARSLGYFHSNAPAVAPALLLALKDQDSYVRSEARESLLEIAPEALTNSAPAQP